MCEGRTGRNPPGVNTPDLTVEDRLGGLVVHVDRGAHALDDKRGSQARGLVHGRALQEDDLNAAEVAGGFPDEPDALFGGDQAALGGVRSDADDESVGDGADTLDDVEVPVREGVKRTGEQRDHRSSSSSLDEACASSRDCAPSAVSSLGRGGPAK